MSKNINLVKTDISNLFEELESIAKESKLEEKKRKDYVEPSVSEISSLFEELEKVNQETKKLDVEDKQKLDEFAGIFARISQEEDEVKEFIEEKTKEPEKDYIEAPEASPVDDVTKGDLTGWITQ